MINYFFFLFDSKNKAIESVFLFFFSCNFFFFCVHTSSSLLLIIIFRNYCVFPSTCLPTFLHLLQMLIRLKKTTKTIIIIIIITTLISLLLHQQQQLHQAILVNPQVRLQLSQLFITTANSTEMTSSKRVSSLLFHFRKIFLSRKWPRTSSRWDTNHRFRRSLTLAR